MDMDLPKLLAAFGSTPIGEPEVLAGGEDNLNLRTETDRGDVVVRRYLLSPAMRVGAELELVDYLARRGYPTPGPLSTVDGGFLVDDGAPVAVFPFVTGDVPAELTADLAAQTGELLARMHVLTAGWTDARIPEFDRVAALRHSAAEPPELAGTDTWTACVTDFLDRRHDALSDLSDLPTGPLHHDLHRQNLLVRDGEIVAVLDFDELNRGPLLIDLARTLFYLAVERPDRRLPVEAANAIVAGYQRARMLTPAERDLLPACFELVALADAAIFLRDNADEDWLSEVDECHSWQVYLANPDLEPLAGT
ncbi:homoserine kinase [Stackebrandtia endophytica]|uniref:Homoserine kinase n=2 Tax=Stackebrandtia endophytica TaxID=1496996 RepID=A0A543AZG3_9ACTN|nr:homoserine kinase [Stackebrandtia endophytica]